MKNKKTNIFIGLSILTVLLYILFCLNLVHNEPDNRFEKAYNAACTIKTYSGDIIGSGVLLENGLVLTAAHVIDTNNDDIIQAGEKIIYVKVGVGAVVTGTVTEYGMPAYVPADFALLELSEVPPNKGLKLTTTWPRLGENLYTIGCPDAQELQLTHGIFTSRTPTKGICSVPIYPGNSGGGIFNDHNEVVGIVSRIGNSPELHGIMTADGPQFFQTNDFITFQNYYSPAAYFAPRFNAGLADWEFRGWSMLFSLPVMVYVWIKRKTLLA